MNIYTIGFTKKNAETFFNFIRNEEISTLIDVRLNNISQLAGFAKRDDLRFFLREICQTEYVHLPDLAPTKNILSNYKKGIITWHNYEEEFMSLMVKRNVERTIDKTLINHSCLLCSEHEPHFCHRRLVVDYLNQTTDLNLKVKHLY
ncbi:MULTISPECIES: DUF488 domain-containing protein [unclassified Vibrio]|uniref:DUF488 domain-containing protein n=1 Tax=unclassified Vibrio TaxID=2614977 RepID=UPI002964A61E|nr:MULTISPECIES: DUF488 domain-containing protein [unclassified Vibrio]MDW1637132.1 DUF488 domain-containing protein [Vibrio sp. Vb2907]MDW1707912.1 DUF488 domain-containing protein [Vibrio sp. Vb2917]MDW1722461.1 DUF488 domain-containing protein [Vibrio sp. Vb2979]